MPYTPPFQDSQFMNAIWAPYSDGGEIARLRRTAQAQSVGAVPVDRTYGENYQRQVYDNNQRSMEANGFLPPGMSRAGLINQARASSPQLANNLHMSGSRSHYPAGFSLAPGQSNYDDAYPAQAVLPSETRQPSQYISGYQRAMGIIRGKINR